MDILTYMCVPSLVKFICACICVSIIHIQIYMHVHIYAYESKIYVVIHINKTRAGELSCK